MSELHIKDTNTSRKEMFMEQLRIRNELKKQDKQPRKIAIDHSRLRLTSNNGIPQVKSSQPKTITTSLLETEKKKSILQFFKKEPVITQQEQAPQQQPINDMQPTPQYHQPPQYHQSPQQIKPTNDNDELIIDEEMTNRNVCIGMINTDIVVEKPPLILTRDDQFEIVTLESEGRLNNDNYCKLFGSLDSF
jgi:hypothetical protein